MSRVVLALLLLTTTLLLPAEAFSPPSCWCDPRHSWTISPLEYCNTNWEVVHTGLLGFVPVCSGTPPACVGLAFTSPPDEDGNGYLLLFGGGFAIPRGNPCAPNLLFPTPISIWPNEMRKEALRPVLMSNYRQIVSWQAELRSLPEGGPQWRGVKMLLNGLLVTTARIVVIIQDPPTPDYAHLPMLPTFAIPAPVLAGADLTQGQADAINAWATKSRKLHQMEAQFTQTLDNFSGAILAHQEGDLNAAPWVRRLARSLDTIALGISGKGLLEVSARASVAATLSPIVIPATCMTSYELASMTPDLVAAGADPTWGLLILQQDMQESGGLCIPATNYPDVMTADNTETSATYATLPSDVRAAQVACSDLGLCSSLTTTTLTLLPSPSGKLKFQVGVAGSDGPYTTAQYAGLTVDVTAPGLVGKTVTLMNGASLVTLTAPPGTYQVTARFPEQKQAKLGASAMTITAVAP